MSLEGNNSIHHHLWRLKYTELNEIYATMSLRSFAVGLIAIFVPIFLYSNGYSLREVCVLFLLAHIVEVFLEYPAAQLIRKVGPKHMIAYSIPFLIAYFFLLQTILIYNWPIWTISSLLGINLAFFWQSYHYDFSKTKHRKKATSDVSRLYIILAVLASIAPLVGGVIATQFSIDWVYAMVMLLLCLTVVPLFKTSEPHRIDRAVNLRRVPISDIKKDLISYMGNGVEGSAVGIFWPLFVFLIIPSYQAVGVVTSLALIITISITYLVGKRADKKNRNGYIKLGGYLSSAINLIQAFAATVFHVFAINIARSFATSIYSAPYTSEYYLHADERSRSEYVFYMESAVDLGRIIFYIILIISSYLLSDKAILSFALILGACGALLIPLMPAPKCEVCSPIVNTKTKLTPQPARRG